MLQEQFEKKVQGMAERQFEENPKKPKDQLTRLGEAWEGGTSREILKIPLGLGRREEYFGYCGTRGLEEAEPCSR